MTTEKKSEKIEWGLFEKIVIATMHGLDKNSFSAKDKILFYKEIVYMLRGGISILQAIDTIKKSTTNYALKTITTSIAHHLNEGKSFSYALSRLPEYFDESDAAIVKTGENTGTLDVVLQELANEYTYLGSIKNRYKSALTYPIILIIMAFGAVIFLFSSVLPSILEMVAGDQQLPQITLILKSVSDFFVWYWREIIVCAITGLIVLMIYASTEVGKNRLSKVLIWLPMIGAMTKTYYLIKWVRYTKLMIGSGLDYLQTFRLLRGVLDIPLYREMIDSVIAGLQLGKTIYDAIKDQTHIIYPNVAVMIKVWEETAHLEEAMENIISMYQEELDTSITQFSKVLEPVILIFMGVIVAFVASGIFGVVFSVMENVWV